MTDQQRTPRGTTKPSPPGYDVIRAGGRYFPVRLHLEDPEQPGTSAFQRPDGSVVSFARRLPAILYLYQQVYTHNCSDAQAEQERTTHGH